MSDSSVQPGPLPFAIDAEVVARLADLAPDPMIAHAKGRVLWANEAAATMMGFEGVAAMVGHPVLELVAPESRVVVADRVRRMLTVGDREPLVPEVFLRRDGGRVEVEVSAAPIGGGVILVVGRDVTRRNQAERERLSAATRFRVFFEATSEPMCIARDGVILEVNAAFVALAAAHDIEAVRGRPLLSMVAPADREAITAFIMDQGGPVDAAARHIVRVVRGDGDERLTELRLTRYTEHGARFVAAVMRDITAERAYEERLTTSEQRHRRLFQQVPVALWEEDCTSLRLLVERLRTAGVADLGAWLGEHPDALAHAARGIDVLEVNEATLALHGAASRAELLDNLHRVFIPEALIGLRVLLTQLAVGAPVVQATGQLGTLSGERRWVLMRLSLVAGHEHDWARVLVSVTDLTEQQRIVAERAALRERLQQAERLEAVGRLAAGVAHDFNNILTGVLGFAELALEDSDPGSELHDNQLHIRDAALRARNLAQQILTFGQQSRPQPRPVDVIGVVREALGLLRLGLPAAVSLATELSGGPIVAMVDPTQLHQVVMNLVTNARDAMREDGGHIEVSVARGGAPPQAADLAAERWVRLRVADDGLGMDEHTRAHLFEPYVTTKRGRGGHGLGLAVVHGIVSGIGGAITVESGPGRGAIFDVYLPAAQGAPAAPLVASARERDGAGERVLLVDDDPTTLLVHARLLMSLGYAVDAVEDAEAALERVRGGRADYDLVITDQNLPGLSGRELARQLLTRAPSVPVLLCSGIDEGGGGGAEDDPSAIQGVLHKPLTRESLAEAVRDAIDAERPGSTA